MQGTNILFTFAQTNSYTEIVFLILCTAIGGVLLLSLRWLIAHFLITAVVWGLFIHALRPDALFDFAAFMIIVLIMGVVLVTSRRKKVVALHRELWERRRSEQALRMSERRHRSMLDGQGEGALLLDSDGRISYANPAAERITGVAEGQLAGQPIDIFFEDGQSRLLLDAAKELDMGETSSHERSLRRADGRARQVLITLSPNREDDGTVVGAFMVLRDITGRLEQQKARQELEAKLERAKHMERLGVLTGGIAHDFNNLLLGIMGNAELALDELPEGRMTKECLEDIMLGASHAAGLCRQMLAYAGKGRFQVGVHDVNDMIREVRDAMASTFPSSISWHYDLDAGVPLVKVDGDQIRQVLMNLVTNAAEAQAERSGVIRVRTMAVQLEVAKSFQEGELAPGSYVCIEVADQGAGMDEVTRSRMFEPFFSTKFTGRGLGLAAVLGTVKRHDGNIEVASQLDAGTTIRVYLPATTEHAARPRASGDTAWRASGRILLVDDDPYVRRPVSRMLEKLGFDVVTASSGEEAVQVYRDQAASLALVMMDLTMPEMNGDVAFARIRAVDPEARGVLISGNSADELARMHVAQGWNAHLTKPYSKEQLVDCLKRVLGG